MIQLRRILTIILMLIAFGCVINAQSTSSYRGANYEFKGNTIVSKSNCSSKAEATKTTFTWKDSKGKEYPVYMSANGSCFVIRTSSKTGKEYRSYLGPEISQQICNKLGIEYKGKKKV